MKDLNLKVFELITGIAGLASVEGQKIIVDNKSRGFWCFSKSHFKRIAAEYGVFDLRVSNKKIIFDFRAK